MDFASLTLVSLATVLGVMGALWAVSVRISDASIADVAWGLLFVLVAGLGLALGEGWLLRRLLVALVVAAWGVRLAVHIGRRNLGRGEDIRYAQWREEHGSSWSLRSLFSVFGLQGLLAVVIALPVLRAQSSPAPAHPTWLDAAGLLVWGGGFVIEVIADAQLAAFKREGSGRVMSRGLWRFSRHPNYFGEAVLWWGIWLIALPAPFGWATVVGPVTITVLLRFVSGVPLAERAMEGRPGWDRYVRETSPFVPLPPRG